MYTRTQHSVKQYLDRSEKLRQVEIHSWDSPSLVAARDLRHKEHEHTLATAHNDYGVWDVHVSTTSVPLRFRNFICCQWGLSF